MDDLVVSYSCIDQVETVHTGALLGDLCLRDPKKPRAGLGNARQLLAASVVSCMCSALAATLDGKGFGHVTLRATASVQTETRERGQKRVAGITVDVVAYLPAEEAAVMRDLQATLDKGCLITASLAAALPVTASLRREDPEQV